jgi:hypothetical protein
MAFRKRTMYVSIASSRDMDRGVMRDPRPDTRTAPPSQSRVARGGKARMCRNGVSSPMKNPSRQDRKSGIVEFSRRSFRHQLRNRGRNANLPWACKIVHRKEPVSIVAYQQARAIPRPLQENAVRVSGRTVPQFPAKRAGKVSACGHASRNSLEMQHWGRCTRPRVG